MSAARKPAAPATYNPAQQRRRGLLAKVHIAKKSLGLSDDDYGAVLLRVTRNASAADCTEQQLEAVVREFEAKGFSAKARPKGVRAADHPGAGKARALWISLHHLGAIGNATEAALETFAKRQLGGSRLQWADQSQVYKLIEALKAIAERHGWGQSLEGVRPGSEIVVLKRRLVLALLVKLRTIELVPVDWRVERAAFEFGGIEIASVDTASASELDLIARVFGEKLRRAPLLMGRGR